MAVAFNTTTPKKLLNQFNARIEQTDQEGKIKTWVRSDDKAYYTHTADEWNSLAWFQPSVEDSKLVFYIIKPKNQDIGTVTYGYYHGHLTETFLNHFDNLFTDAISSASPKGKDKVA